MIRYGLKWPDTSSDLEIERYMVRKGGQWLDANGNQCGNGLFFHYKEMERIIWPDEFSNRWTDWMLKLILEEHICVFAGSRDSGKTRRASKYSLCDYWCFPHDTLILMTSTTINGLELRVWGDIKSLWERATDRHPQLEGQPVDAKHGIFTDALGEGANIRDMRKGIIGIPTMTSEGEYSGLSLKNFAGIKQNRRRLIGDEMQFLSQDYLKVLYSMDDGKNFKGIFLGNMIADNGKALDKIAEPESGWHSLGEITKTTQWKNKFGGVTLNLVGIDSPNLDPETLGHFPGMITQAAIDRAAALPGAKDSLEWWSQIMGVRKSGVVSDRVLTTEMVEINGGFKDVIWDGEPTLKICGVDAGYGGDECVETYIECGTEVGGTEVMCFKEQKVVPVLLSSEMSAEDQIATHVKADCERWGVPDSNVFIEAGMRATLGISFSRIMSAAINAINFGGPATQRPVAIDLFVFDEKTQQRRLKTCAEHYSKFVSELAYMVRAVVECGQARMFPRVACDEFEKRKTRFVYNDRYEIESKVEFKERNSGKSPNFSDSVMIVVEGARRLGFVIQRTDTRSTEPTLKELEAMPPEQRLLSYFKSQSKLKPLNSDTWLEDEIAKRRSVERQAELHYD